METYAFSNGVVLRRVDLLEEQIERYGEPGNPNLHEPIEEEHLLRLFQEEKGHEPVFLDVGAAVGYYTILVKKLCPQARVFAIEPLPVHRDAFEVNLALNGLSHEGVSLLDCAIAASDGMARLQNLRFGSRLTNRVDATAIEVTARSLSSVLSKMPPVHLMKMDIQGLELEVLNAAADILSAGYVKHVLIGTHGLSVHKRVVERVRACGFEIRVNEPKPLMQPDGIVAATFKLGRKG